MKKLLITKISILVLVISLFSSGCIKDTIKRTYTIYTPVYKEKSEVLSNIKSTTPKTISETGKIYMYGRYIFLNEVSKGVHIIDNADPANPKVIKFIDIPGNLDIAVKGNSLYADLYTDLLVIDISDPLQAKLSKVVENVFPERRYVSGFIADTSKIIVGWNKKDTTVEGDRQFFFNNCRNCGFALAADASLRAAAPGAGGIGGSMARFAIVNDYLYTVNISQLGVFNINEPQNPVKLGTSYIGWNIETVYPFKQKLFIGSSTGMFIYDITNPQIPKREGMFSHARACDPVVADDDYAFVTLRSGNNCNSTSNQLDVIDIKNFAVPNLLKTYSMTNPFGLAIDGNLLFVCDGPAGLKIYDRTEPTNLVMLHHIKNIETFDAIARNKTLLVVAKDGLYQYDYSQTQQIRLLSKLSINQ